MIPKIVPILTASLIVICSTVRGADLTFSGGSGAPLQLTLLESISYTVTASGSANDAPVFVFAGVGNIFSNSFPSATGSMAFSINGGALNPMTTVNSGVASFDVVANDLYVFGAVPGVAVDDVVTLMAGTLTTSGSFAGLAPTNGSFTSFLVNGSGNRISTNGVPVGGSVRVSEGGNSAILLLVSAAAMLALRRRLGA
jgi:hypothetical protein